MGSTVRAETDTAQSTVRAETDTAQSTVRAEADTAQSTVRAETDTVQSTVRAEADTVQRTVRAEADTVARLFLAVASRAEEPSAPQSDATGPPEPRLLWQEVIRSYNQLAGLGQGHDLQHTPRTSNTWMSFHNDEKILHELSVDGDNIMAVPPSSPTQFLLSMTKTNI